MGGKGRRLGEGVDLVLDLVLDVVVVLDLVLELVLELVLDLVEGSVPLVLEVLLDDLVEGHDPLVLEVVPDDFVEGPDSLVLLLFAILDDLAVPVVALEALLTPDPLVVSQSSSSEDQSPDHDPLPALPEVPPLDPPPLLPDFPEPDDPAPPLLPDLPLDELYESPLDPPLLPDFPEPDGPEPPLLPDLPLPDEPLQELLQSLVPTLHSLEADHHDEPSLPLDSLPDFPEPEDPEPPLFPDLPLPDDEEPLHSLLLEADQYESGEFQWFAAAHNESQLFS